MSRHSSPSREGYSPVPVSLSQRGASSSATAFDSSPPARSAMSDEEDPQPRNDISRSELFWASRSAIPRCLLWLPLPCCWQYQEVRVKEESLLMVRGAYYATLREPGSYCINSVCCGLSTRSVSTAIHSNDLNNLTVMDKAGRPLVASAVVNWRVNNSRKALLDVSDYKLFITNQAEVVLKRLCSLYPYDNTDSASTASSDSSSATPASSECLKTESSAIRACAMEMLQSRVSQAGLIVTGFELNEISYAPSVSAMMLARQHAEVMLDARKAVVHGAVAIASETIRKLRAADINLKSDEANRLAAGIVLTLCSEAHVAHTMKIADI